ncbi:amidohydrolase family protein [Synergistaceae bacterium OttesenSCG-928-I11]|nr:amidohydrolase family protein [Synergistaceae bacterium OttesenSCG-928-I11]
MKTLIRTKGLYDGLAEEALFGMDVLVEDGRIVKIEKSGTTTYDAETLDYSDRPASFVMPGMIDSHLHLAHDGVDKREKNDRAPQIAYRLYHNGIRNLLIGITTQRDCGTTRHIDVSYKESLRIGLINGPRTLICGQPIIATAGHCPYMGRQVDGPIEAMKAVREQLEERVDFIKLMVTGGVSTLTGLPTTPQMTKEEVEACVMIAHNNDKMVAVHAEGGIGVKWALDAGIDTLEHGIYLSDEHIAQMAEQGTWFVPTLYAIREIGKTGPQEPVPISQFMAERCAEAFEFHADSFKRAYKAGVKMAGGTDYKQAVLVEEVLLMTSLGMKKSEGLRAITSQAAKMLKLDDQIGSVEVGKKADLIIIDGNPLDDIANLRNVRAVMQEGDVVVRDGMLKPRTSYLHYPIQ